MLGLNVIPQISTIHLEHKNYFKLNGHILDALNSAHLYTQSSIIRLRSIIKEKKRTPTFRRQRRYTLFPGLHKRTLDLKAF